MEGVDALDAMWALSGFGYQFLVQFVGPVPCPKPRLNALAPHRLAKPSFACQEVLGCQLRRFYLGILRYPI